MGAARASVLDLVDGAARSGNDAVVAALAASRPRSDHEVVQSLVPADHLEPDLAVLRRRAAVDLLSDQQRAGRVDMGVVVVRQSDAADAGRWDDYRPGPCDQ